ncbi:MAG: sodium/proton-translocating pyrophosphatase, partial [Anaerolineae bacterium]|nr:sodium/proton-translocating pyrophosphatase [Anaerolineae bacterium]
MDFLTDNVTVASIIAVVVSVLGLAFAWRQRSWVLAQPAGNEDMTKIATAIQRGAQAFLSREYRAVAVLVVIVTIALIVLGLIPNSGMSSWTALAFVTGAIASGLAGYGGMYIAVRANVRTTQAASESLNKGLRVAFSSGTVMANLVVSLALLGIGVLFILFTNVLNLDPATAASALAGFGFGGTSIAIFARVGGGIYTKAADVGADLVGKTELNIPEDSPQNPATIADNVGDNVGDVAGMGSDLFESYAGSIIAAITLALLGAGIAADRVIHAQVFPLLVAAVGIIIGIAASFLVQTKEGATQEQLLWSLRKGVYGASGMVAVAIVALGLLLNLGWGVIIATLSGLIGGVLIGYFTEYFTSGSYKPTQRLAESAE